MSAEVKLSAKLPGNEETNGLDSLHDELKEDPAQIVCAIVWFDVSKVVHDVDTKKDVPTVRIRRIEPIGVVEKVPAAITKLALQMAEKRTGRTPLPFGETASSADEES